MLRHTFLLAIFLLALLAPARAGDEESRAALQKKLDAISYETGKIPIKDGLAEIDVPAGFAFLDANDSKTVLTDLWRNPPDPDVLGMIVPKGFDPTKGGWAVVISYDGSGYVSDTDAGKIDYTDMLKTMQAQAVDENKEREKEGYPTLDIVGWAEDPHYDAESHKLYWARELKFGGDRSDTLNYCIRILGRHGVLQLNAISSMKALPEIKAQMPAVLGMVNFKEGNRYVDFDPKIDKLAGYGLAALIVGGVAAKAGLFKGLIALLLVGKKFVVMGVIALWVGIKKFFKGRKSG